MSVDWEILNELPQLYSNKERNLLNTLISSFVKHGTSICEFKPKYIENGASYLNDNLLFSSDFFPLAQLVRVKLTITLNNEQKNFYRTIPDIICHSEEALEVALNRIEYNQSITK